MVLENGERYDGDLLVGADGISFKVRKNLFGPTDAVYSGYTCYTGIADFVPADIESVGYVPLFSLVKPCDMLECAVYFWDTSSTLFPVGAGKKQWYAFHNEPAGGVDSQGKKERLLNIFGGWCDNVIDLLHATDEDAILRGDIYDRIPSLTWGRGRVTLLGDSIHAMQPNLGQGGCMAIEDSYQLALEIDNAWKQGVESGAPIDVVSSLRSYERARILRVAIIHGMARMAAIMASTYKAYLGVGLGSLWASDQLRTWFEDNDALEQTINGECEDKSWFLFSVGNEVVASQPIFFLSRDENKPFVIGSEKKVNFPGKSGDTFTPDGAFFVIDLQSEHGYPTFEGTLCILRNRFTHEERRSRVPSNVPARLRPSDVIEFGSDKKAASRVKVMRLPQKINENKEDEHVQAV
ncbi:Zeaxanthin epoxidase [Hibiscus syriacus]|uniref:Zeaxanthin epoxidase n=1 Tax=Hibiscus syriacus TaxID=106335 RepID=A0A6A2ZRT0_HIBSY|nr:Zeaxanthin epoxidase [Hibiscus syriacus]